MKAKLGLAIGFNVAVACLVMQGCKAPGARGNASAGDVKTIEEAPAPAKAPANDISVADAPAPATEPAAPVVAAEPAPAVAPVVAEPAPAAAPAPVDAEFTLYTVKPGDMLSKIAKRYNIRQRAILDLNPGLAPNKLYAGKKIKLPGKVEVGAAEPAAAAAAPAPAADAASTKAPKAAKAAKYTGATKEYVVKNGDSLGKIAQIHGTNVRTIKELNGLKSDRVFVGKKLKVPTEKAAAPAAKKDAAKAPVAKDAKKDAAKVPAVKDAKKDVAKAPAAKDAKTDAAKDPAAKDAKKDAPAAEAAAPAPAAAPAADATAPVPAAPAADAAAPAPAAAPAAEAAAPEVHTVKEGEDVVSIAISYGISPSTLMDANDLKSSEVKPGDKLKIPVKNAQ